MVCSREWFPPCSRKGSTCKDILHSYEYPIYFIISVTIYNSWFVPIDSTSVKLSNYLLATFVFNINLVQLLTAHITFIFNDKYDSSYIIRSFMNLQE